MKPLFSLLVLMVACSFSFATVRTVCNMPYGGGQYTTFNAALSASNNGDTIYVQGSSINYGTVNIDKPIVVIGTGHNPEKTNPIVSSFFDILITSSDVQLIGLRTRQISAAFLSNGVIKKCRITGSGGLYPIALSNVSNWLIEGNIIETPDVVECIYFFSAPSPGTIIQNNIFLSPYFKIAQLVNLPVDRTSILNNVFLGHTPFTPTFSYVSYCDVHNNIFYNSIPDGNNSAYISNSLMNNNITFGSTDDAIYQPGANNVNADPLFTTYPGAQPQYDYAWDLSLQVTSPGHNTGTDGTDRGVYGGIVPTFLESGEPAIAEITAFSITSPTTIAPGGTLTISVTSKRVP